MRPKALPDARELAERRARRARRRRQRDQQQPEPAPPWPPAALELSPMAELEAAFLVVPMGCRLVVVPVPKPRVPDAKIAVLLGVAQQTVSDWLTTNGGDANGCSPLPDVRVTIPAEEKP